MDKQKNLEILRNVWKTITFVLCIISAYKLLGWVGVVLVPPAESLIVRWRWPGVEDHDWFYTSEIMTAIITATAIVFGVISFTLNLGDNLFYLFVSIGVVAYAMYKIVDKIRG